MKHHKTPGGLVILELEPGDLPADHRNHERLPGERFREPLHGRFWIEISPIATEILGRHGRLLSASKQAYALEHPGHEVWFNACVFDRRGVEIWFGDLDLTRDASKLVELSRRVGIIYATHEQPYRWTGLPTPGRRRAPSIRRIAP